MKSEAQRNFQDENVEARRELPRKWRLTMTRDECDALCQPPVALRLLHSFLPLTKHVTQDTSFFLLMLRGKFTGLKVPLVFVKPQQVLPFSDYFVFADVRYSLAGPTYGIVEYRKSHIKRAVFVDLDRDLTGEMTGTTARHPLPPAKRFVEYCHRSGLLQPAVDVSGYKPVVCYDDTCGALGASRLWWMLTSLGAEAFVLDGGMQAWKAAGCPCEAGEPQDPPESSPSLGRC